jgi:5-formaminoimidazole-4-carboxamide-1-beta-D-ribofuranosyl 5'-monophosphate synthetase
MVADKGKEEMVVFDVSLRIPGSPLTQFTPHSGYLYGESISYGERIAMELNKAIKTKRLKEIVT